MISWLLSSHNLTVCLSLMKTLTAQIASWLFSLFEIFRNCIEINICSVALLHSVLFITYYIKIWINLPGGWVVRAVDSGTERVQVWNQAERAYECADCVPLWWPLIAGKIWKSSSHWHLGRLMIRFTFLVLCHYIFYQFCETKFPLRVCMDPPTSQVAVYVHVRSRPIF